MMAHGAIGGLLVRLDRVAALAAYFPVAMLTEKNPSTASRLGAGNSLPDQFPVYDLSLIHI